MRVIDIIKIKNKLAPFNMILPELPPKSKLTNNPSLEQIFDSLKSYNIPYNTLSIQQIQCVIKLMQQRYKAYPDNIFVLQTLSEHLNELDAWVKMNN